MIRLGPKVSRRFAFSQVNAMEKVLGLTCTSGLSRVCLPGQHLLVFWIWKFFLVQGVIAAGSFNVFAAD